MFGIILNPNIIEMLSIDRFVKLNYRNHVHCVLISWGFTGTCGLDRDQVGEGGFCCDNRSLTELVGKLD